MKPPFYKAVDRVFVHVLDLVERLHAAESVDAEEERAKIRSKLDDAAARLAEAGQVADWELAQYSLVCWIDEMVAGELWAANSLEFEYFHTQVRSHEFYNRAEQAMALPRKDALECFYVAVVLGFRGMYASREALAEEREFLEFDPPESLEAWARRVAGVIRVANDVPPTTMAPKTVQGAPPLEAKFDCVGSWSLAAALAAGAVLTYFTVYAS